MVTLKQAISAELLQTSGIYIESHRIYTDNTDRNYLPAHSLENGHPLVLQHFKKKPFMIIPTSDYQKLKDGETTMQKYVSTAIWNYGYYLGLGSELHDIFWQPLEKNGGIHDVALISRYWKILECRTRYHAPKNLSSEDRCKLCKVDHCPFSPFDFKKEGASWNNEVKEVDDRKKLFELVKNRVKENFGFKVTACKTHNLNSDYIIMEPGFCDCEVIMRLPQTTLIKLLNHPGRYDLEMIVDEWQIVVLTPSYLNEKGEFIDAQFFLLREDDAESAYQLWNVSGTPNRVRNWSIDHILTKKKRFNRLGLLTRIKNWFSRKLKPKVA